MSKPGHHASGGSEAQGRGPVPDPNSRAYYEASQPGRDDYWRKMAAPRFRVATIIEWLRRSPPATLVDLGCGGGQLLREVQRELPHAALCGFDLSASQIAANRERLPGIDWQVANLDGPVELGDAHRDRFEAVVASEIIEHVGDPAAFLRNAAALAVPGEGRLILSTQSGRIRETERRVGHRRHFTRSQLEALLEAAGWEPIRLWRCGFPFHDLSKWVANRHPDRTMAEYSEKPYGFKQNAVCFLLRLAFRFNSKRRGAQLFAVARRA
jgi:2-polyprenyl-3-methyl-5-hydroxy-6-metoxy-1,4-benzoquinol methylase